MTKSWPKKKLQFDISIVRLWQCLHSLPWIQRLTWRRKLIVLHWQLPPAQHNAVAWWMAISLIRHHLLLINVSFKYKEISTSYYVDFIVRDETDVPYSRQTNNKLHNKLHGYTVHQRHQTLHCTTNAHNVKNA